MTTTAKLNRFLTLGMPDDGSDCESCSFRTGTEQVYRIKSDKYPEWNGRFVILCDKCVHASDVTVS